MMTPASSPKIIAPVTSLEEAQRAFDAGADECYCGAMFDDWVAEVGDSDILSRRQGRPAHVRTPEELASIAGLANEKGKDIALTLNARYTSVLEKPVLRLADRWEKMGGQAVMVTDLGILLALQRRRSALNRHLSLLAGTFNSASVRFFAGLGVSRVVLPRDLTLEEMRFVTQGFPDMEYEVLVMFQKCEFIDGLCGFYHGVKLPHDVPAEFDYHVPKNSMNDPVVWSHDPDYQGHGCLIPWETDAGPVRHCRQDDLAAPSCAACALPVLSKMGVKYFKIAGRAYPSELMVRTIRFLRRSLEMADSHSKEAHCRRNIRQLYRRTFGRECSRSNCYYEMLDSK